MAGCVTECTESVVLTVGNKMLNRRSTNRNIEALIDKNDNENNTKDLSGILLYCFVVTVIVTQPVMGNCS